ncbi:biotin/lipoyl-containing protein [Williamsia sp. DF01-3]|uniref:biotin/lipoyl-containing protein n=1 Tax=Williamsia sp. DF01-3 TaxID=2934157 RepID=UPI001FF2BCC0|nr:biotin/lipoyl-containing protein [Williamsia sp. DF01-3]MCK0516704.1 biotin/lipoyl-binding protein [Williamsia sp. DF01-3]
MKHKLKIPKLGVAMNEGSIVEWHVETGDTVKPGQVIYTLATDKAESEIESPVNGIITIIGEVDETYPVGTVVASVEA